MRTVLRLLLCAGLLAGPLASLATAEWHYAVMYSYSGLTREGSTVYGYAQTWLSYPYVACNYWSYEDCWEEYTSHAEANLFRDSVWQDGAASTQENGPAEAWCYGTVDAGYWQLMHTHELEVAWIDYWSPEYYWWQEDWFYVSGYHSLTINPEISISSGQFAYDGDGAYFDVIVGLGTPASYSWSFDYPSGAGNGPNVQFSPQHNDYTYTNAHWFAYPDQQCSAPIQSSYDITATVGFQSGPLSDTTGLTVTVPWAPGGETYPPSLIDHIQLVVINNLWRVWPAPYTYFTRTNPLVIMWVPWTSQFHDKVYEHEQVHNDQFRPGGSYHTLEGMYNPDDAYSAIINLTDATSQGLQQKVLLALDSYYINQAVSYELYLKVPAEREAYGVSDNMSPSYIYQNCGRY